MPAENQPWHLSGRLDFDRVPALYRASLAWYVDAGLPNAIDLGRVEYTDSSALALLLEWQAWAHSADCRLEFHNPPEGLRVYAQLTDTTELLGWTRTNKQ